MSNVQRGTRLGDYTLDALVAEGAMGSIYRASRADSKHTFAVKVMLPEYSSDADFRKRFTREVGMLQELQHPHIVPVYDYGEEDDVLYFVMPYINGSSLHEVLDEQRFSPATAWLILEPIAQALTYIHSHHVIHRDLKPANILVQSGVRAHPYIADFGLSKPLDKSTMTEAGIAVGTPAYMSPEQVRGEPVTSRSDIYALGIILYEMLLGRVPFADGNTEMIALAQVREQPPLPQVLNPKFPKALNEVILRALAKQPSQRFDTADHFAATYFETLKTLPSDVKMANYW